MGVASEDDLSIMRIALGINEQSKYCHNHFWMQIRLQFINDDNAARSMVCSWIEFY